MKQIFITTDQLSKCTALAEILETLFPECEIKVIVRETPKTGRENKAVAPASSVSPH